MTRYYFHIHQGQFLIRDEEGTCCANVDAARREADSSMDELVRAALRSGDRIPSKIEVEDGDGNLLASVRASVLAN
jgi:hypothetical protein